MRDMIFIALIVCIAFIGVWVFENLNAVVLAVKPVHLLVIGMVLVGGLILKIWKDDRELSQPNN